MNILATITKYKALKAELETKKAELDSLKTELENYVLNNAKKDENGKTRFVCGQYTVTITPCKREDIDKNGLKEQFPEIAEMFKTISEYNRMLIK